MRGTFTRAISAGGSHPVVIVSIRPGPPRKDFVEVLDCSSQRANRPPAENEVVLDTADGLDWPTFCKCDCIFAVPREELKARKGSVTAERRRNIVRAIVQSHGWNAL
ncbi:MAG TPA: type II toxin-antitoxin system PemK/MazF family toxin [Methylomirabilota bacterium]|nr:type II toxin-antitoxin system PemK/MazF family toxin [Methylomirabilota bacterium]